MKKVTEVVRLFVEEVESISRGPHAGKIRLTFEVDPYLEGQSTIMIEYCC